MKWTSIIITDDKTKYYFHHSRDIDNKIIPLKIQNNKK
jgi:hypothetical protein